MIDDTCKYESYKDQKLFELVDTFEELTKDNQTQLTLELSKRGYTIKDRLDVQEDESIIDPKNLIEKIRSEKKSKRDYTLYGLLVFVLIIGYVTCNRVANSSNGFDTIISTLIGIGIITLAVIILLLLILVNRTDS